MKNQNDMKVSTKEKESKGSEGNAEKASGEGNLLLTSIFVKIFSRDLLHMYCLFGILAATIWLSSIMRAVLERADELSSKNPDYDWPTHHDIWHMLIAAVTISIARHIFVSLLTNPMKRILKPCAESEIRPRAEKMTTSLFKTLFYIFIVSWAYIMLKDTEFLGSQFGGSGDFKNIWKGFPYHDYPDGTRLYYMVSFAYHAQSLFFHVLISEPRNDYMEMLLHHTVTCFLIYLSFVLNYFRVGMMVLFVHDFSDIFVYFGKFVADLKWNVQLPTYLVIMSAFGYSRLYVYPVYVIRWGALYCDDVSNVTILGRDVGIAMLTMLLTLHIYWYCLLLKLGYSKVLKGKVAEDVFGKIEADQKDLTQKEFVDAEIKKKNE
mmetsp:Transcript_10993/g.12033  ORF Transcript_10993/g.12033 Transcript_10993/m.12033 type:complete len:377 (-) Transcript_10993:684-1814(-)